MHFSTCFSVMLFARFPSLVRLCAFLKFFHYHDINRIVCWHCNRSASHAIDGARKKSPREVCFCRVFGFKWLEFLWTFLLRR